MFSVVVVMDAVKDVGMSLLVRVIEGRKGRFLIDTGFLVSVRKRYGCSAQLFAKIGGWKKAHQSFLEHPGEKKVNLKTLLKLYYTLGILEGTKNDTTYFLNKKTNQTYKELQKEFNYD